MLKVLKGDDAFFYAHKVYEVLLCQRTSIRANECCFELTEALAAWFDAWLPL